jgi:hypothetical protein
MVQFSSLHPRKVLLDTAVAGTRDIPSTVAHGRSF